MRGLFLLITFFLTTIPCYSSMTGLTDTIYEDKEDFHADFPGRNIVVPPQLPDSADVARLKKKHFWRAAGETVGTNLALWSYDRYIQHGEFAYISWNTIKENFKHGFEWDDDYLGTNMFAHPYNGSIYFNAGRSNGYNFWQSELFAIGGSAMWEMFMENEYPSTNDIIATPIGGAALGEVLYRTSDLVIDDRTAGWNRFGREVALFVLDPMRGLTRIFTGDAWKRRPTPGRQFGIPPISVEVSAGLNMLNVQNHKNATLAGAAAEIKVEYGDKFAERTSAPYDYFQFLLELNGMKTQPVLNRVEIIGRLLSKEMLDKKEWDLSVGLYQHFDYFDSDTIRKRMNIGFLNPCEVPYKFGTPASVGGGVLTRYIPKGSTWQLEGSLHFNGVLLAGVLTDFYRDYHRNYNWGSGFAIKTAFNWALQNHRFTIDVADQIYNIYTWGGYDQSQLSDGTGVSGVMGDESRSWFNHFEAQINYRLWQRIYLSAGVDLYHRQTNYFSHFVTENQLSTYTPIITSNQIGWHLMLTYKF